MAKPKLYYMQNLNAGYLGNSPMFWAAAGGYTQWLDAACQFTAAEVKGIVRGSRGTHKWKRWPVSFIDRRARRTVDMQDLRNKQTR